MTAQAPYARSLIEETGPRATEESNSPKSGEEGKTVEEMTSDEEDDGYSKYGPLWRRLLTPKNVRWNTKSPPEFTSFLCILYALVCTICTPEIKGTDAS